MSHLIETAINAANAAEVDSPATATGASTEPTASKRAAGSAKPKTVSAKPTPLSKTETVLKMLRSAKGSTLQAMTAATGWQAHSMRGFLSGTVRKTLGLELVSDIGKDGARRYRIENANRAS